MDYFHSASFNNKLEKVYFFFFFCLTEFTLHVGEFIKLPKCLPTTVSAVLKNSGTL